MKHKKFKIEGTTLFVYRPQMRLNNKAGRGDMPTDPTTITMTTTISTGFFAK